MTPAEDQDPASGGEKLTHIDSRGNAHMVDVADKAVTHRIAVAGGQYPHAPGNP